MILDTWILPKILKILIQNNFPITNLGIVLQLLRSAI